MGLAVYRRLGPGTRTAKPPRAGHNTRQLRLAPPFTNARSVHDQAGSDRHDQIKAGHQQHHDWPGWQWKHEPGRPLHFCPIARGGMRMGHGQVMDSMFLDGLEDA